MCLLPLFLCFSALLATSFLGVAFLFILSHTLTSLSFLPFSVPYSLFTGQNISGIFLIRCKSDSLDETSPSQGLLGNNYYNFNLLFLAAFLGLQILLGEGSILVETSRTRKHIVLLEVC